MNIELIKLFNSALSSEKNVKTFAEVNAYAMQRGYLVHPDVCTQSVMDFLKEVQINPNATFYKTWEDVTSKSRLELLIDQLLHYFTTYGTDFSLGQGYVPNDGPDFVPVFTQFKTISPITKEELYDRCLGLLTSGIALKKDTMMVVADYVIANINRETFDIDTITNREAQVYFSDSLGIFPNQPINLFRYIVYKTTGNPMLIKDKASIEKIKASNTQFDFGMLSDRNMEALASCFLRYKELFLAFKHVKVDGEGIDKWGYKRMIKVDEIGRNAPYINKLRKMANKFHKPMRTPFWNSIFSEQKSIEEIAEHMSELTSYKKVTLMQTCLDRATAVDHQFYLIRNQKGYLRENYKPSTDVSYLMMVFAMLRTSLIDTLKGHASKVVTSVDASTGETVTQTVPVVIRIVDGVKVALPTSEKSFIGNYPFGTSYKMTNNNFFGIYWRNEWGTRDYDLSFVNINGSRIGWNASYYNANQDVIFSGDMTNADPEAAEVLAIKKNCPQGIIKVNQFSGNNKSKFQFFFGQEANVVQKFQKLYNRGGGNVGYMVDPNNIKLIVDVDHDSDSREHAVGVCNGEEIVLMAINTGNTNVSNIRGGIDHIQHFTDAIMHKTKCFVDASDILAAAGFQLVDDSYDGDVDIDFKNLDKDSLIALMA